MEKVSKGRPAANPTKIKRMPARRTGALKVLLQATQPTPGIPSKPGPKVTFSPEELAFLESQEPEYLLAKNSKAAQKTDFYTSLAKRFYEKFVASTRPVFSAQVAVSTNSASDHDNAVAGPSSGPSDPLSPPAPSPIEVEIVTEKVNKSKDSHVAQDPTYNFMGLRTVCVS